ncbi:MAG TPA: hypothetical protein V6C63_19340 [Allocoleopsis sp.]
MRSTMLALFGAGLGVVGWAVAGQAQTVGSPAALPDGVTLSSQSLQGVQTRSWSDLKVPRPQATLELRGNSNSGGRSASPGFKVQDRTVVIVERSRPSEKGSTIFLDDVSSDREQRFKVQYQLTDQ